MVNVTDPLMSPYAGELEKIPLEKRTFLGLDIDDDAMQKIAKGEMNPENRLMFKEDENEKYLV